MAGLLIQSRPHAQRSQHHTVLSGLAGQTDGQQYGPYHCHVKAEKIGSHSPIFNPSNNGIPKRVGSFQGANGAQLRGEDIHHHHQNPQDNHANIVSIHCIILSILISAIFKEFMKSSWLESYPGEVSSLSGIPSQSVSLLNSQSWSFA